jgi:hypothetical protein
LQNKAMRGNPNDFNESRCDARRGGRRGTSTPIGRTGRTGRTQNKAMQRKRSNFNEALG